MLCDEQIPSRIFIQFQKSEQIVTNLIIKYINYIKNLINNGLAIIVYNSFKGYLKESVKKKFWDYSFDLAVISDDLTSIYQLLDVTINKPFKDNLYKKYHLQIVERGA